MRCDRVGFLGLAILAAACSHPSSARRSVPPPAGHAPAPASPGETLGASKTKGSQLGAEGTATGSGEPRVRPIASFEGVASYYSDALAGRSTASGEPYRPEKLTAAHRRLPFGSRVRVTRRDTGASVEVVINDRGPFGDRRRVIDLSKAAARRLKMLKAGIVEVRVEVLSEGR